MKDDLSYIAEPLRGLAVKIDEVSPDLKNERMHNKKNIESIKGSLRRFGQRTPLVVNMANLKLIEKGAGTWQAAKELGWGHIAVLFVEDDEVTQDGYRVADNRSSDTSMFDDDALAETLKSLAEQDALEGLGWDEEELETIIRGYDIVDDPLNEWEGMPEFNQEDLTAVKSIRVNFASLEDMRNFGELIEQKITEKTRSLWFPKADVIHADVIYIEKAYQDES